MSAGKSELESIDQDRLLRELDDLGQRLKEMRLSGEESDSLLALVRVVGGLNLEEWQALSRRHQIDDYLAVPLQGSKFPELTRLLKLIRRLSHESRHDALTGLLNRRAFHLQLEIEMERSQRMETLLSLAILDVDDFKEVNDSFGHQAGDEVLRRLADLLRQKTRKIDVTARIGGEEFAMLLPGSGPHQARAMLRRLRGRLLQSPFRCQGEEFETTFSAGITSYRGQAQISAKQLIREADRALYEAKEAGKDRIECARRSLRMAEPEGAVEAEERDMLLSRTAEEKDEKPASRDDDAPNQD